MFEISTFFVSPKNEKNKKNRIQEKEKTENRKQKKRKEKQKNPTWASPHPRGGVRRAVRADRVGL
jgi:hypothetical protein